MKNELHVLYGCDDNYAPYTGVSMTSLFENNRHLQRIVVYLAGMDIRAENLEKFRATARRYGREFILLDTKRAMQQIRQYNCNGWNGSLATWLRFFVFDQIPQQVERLLWLDSDTLVTDDLAPLFTLDMKGAPVACAYDSVAYVADRNLRLDPKTGRMYNAGVIVFDLEQWRKRSILPGFMARLERCGRYYAANDQDLLNDYFRGAIYTLPPRYNLQGLHMAYAPGDYCAAMPHGHADYYPQQLLEQALDRPAVIHFFRFLGDYPWETGDNLHPVRPLYESWKARSLWAAHVGPPCRDKLFFRIEKALYRLLPKRAFLRLFFAFKKLGCLRVECIPDELVAAGLYRDLA